MERPKIEEIVIVEDFKNWYWLKDEMITICKLMQLPYTGKKFDLRDRIIYALENEGKLFPQEKGNKSISKFNWSKTALTLETQITDNVSFGPNFRRFMKSYIGNHFSCHSDFMDWVKSNVGKTLKDAIIQWEVLEERKRDPSFRRSIADHNMYNQYMRDFLDDNVELGFREAKKYWVLKKRLPVVNGFVKYEAEDLMLG